MTDEYVLDTEVVHEFVAEVQASIGAASSPEHACSLIRPRFAELLADDFLCSSSDGTLLDRKQYVKIGFPFRSVG